MELEFNEQLQAQNSISIEDIGSFALEATNDDGYYFYLVAKSFFGHTIIASCGPIVPDIITLPAGFTIKIDKYLSKPDKLAIAVSKFLNDQKKKITSAKIIPEEIAQDQFPDMGRYLRDLNEENF